MSKWQLINSMLNGTITVLNGFNCTVIGMQREDGNPKRCNWNIEVMYVHPQKGNTFETVFVKTID